MKSVLLIAALYGVIVGGEFKPAPKVVNYGGYWRGSDSLTEAQANSLKYKMKVDTPPTCKSNEYYVAKGWREDSRIYRVYEVKTIEPQPRKWTPLSIKRSAEKLGHWASLKSFLESANAYDDFIMAQYEAENDADFVKLMSAARQQFGDSVVDSILNNAEVEP